MSLGLHHVAHAAANVDNKVSCPCQKAPHLLENAKAGQEEEEVEGVGVEHASLQAG